MSSDFGMSANGFKIKRIEDIKKSLEESVRAAIGADATLLPDSVEGQIISVFSQIYSEMWEQLLNAYGAFNPVYVTGQSLDNLVALNGLTRLEPSKSQAFLSITGVDNTIIPAGSIVSHSATGVEFLTDSAVQIGVGFATGTATVFASSRYTGAVVALAGTLTVIGSPVNGWTGVTNNNDASLGRNEEVDSELRARRARSLSLSGLASLDAIISGVQSVLGVTFAGAVENFSDIIDPNGLQPHSFEVVVLGGTDLSIAQAIWEKKPVGIETNGSSSANANDIFGNLHLMKFSRPTQIQIWLNANITFDGKVPDDAATVMTQAILDFVSGELISGQSLSVGDDVFNSRMYMPLNIVYPNHTINSLTMSIDGAVFDPSDISIAYDEISVWDAARIVLTVG